MLQSLFSLAPISMWIPHKNTALSVPKRARDCLDQPPLSITYYEPTIVQISGSIGLDATCPMGQKNPVTDFYRLMFEATPPPNERTLIPCIQPGGQAIYICFFAYFANSKDLVNFLRHHVNTI